MRGRGMFAALLGAAVAAAAGAGELRVLVRASDGTPVEHAVVSLGGREVPADDVAVLIDQRGKQFQPWVVALRRGQAVAFSNQDDITHHVYSFSPARRFSFRL